MKAVVAVLLLVCVPLDARAHGNTGAPPPIAVPDAVLEEAALTVDAFHDALTKADRQAAQAFMDDNVQIYEQGWVERSKAEYAAHHLGSDAEFSAATKRTRTARSGIVLGDLAYVVSEGKTTGTFKGKAVDSLTLETMVLRRGPNGWRIVHIHWSSRSVKK